MSQLSATLRQLDKDTLAFWCPGCDEPHALKANIWNWDGNVVNPTFNPSVLVTSGHYTDGKHPCWCDYNKEHPDKAIFSCHRCHSYVRSGQIEFLTDSTHALAGKTVPLAEWPEDFE